MLRIRLQKFGSLLGLLAILLSTLAPTVSQTLAAHHRLGNALATYCTAEAGADATQVGDRHAPARHWQACPYCGLLAHVPGLPGASVPFAVAVAVARAAVASIRIEVRALTVQTAAQPRAPPVFS